MIEAKPASFSEEQVSLAKKFIRCIERHRPIDEPGTPDYDACCWFVDTSLTVLGWEKDKYEEYRKRVRRDNRWAGDERYRTTRAKIFQKLLSRNPLFLTEVMRKEFETVARENMVDELQFLNSKL